MRQLLAQDGSLGVRSVQDGGGLFWGGGGKCVDGVFAQELALPGGGAVCSAHRAARRWRGGGFCFCFYIMVCVDTKRQQPEKGGRGTGAASSFTALGVSNVSDD